MKNLLLAVLILLLFHPHSGAVGATQTYIKPLLDVKTLSGSDLTPQGRLDIIEATQLSTSAAPPSGGVCGSDDCYMNYIFAHEGSLGSVNSIGCKGEGQDCNGQLVIDCPNWATDKPCQDAFFTRYMLARYGTWLAAYNFKVATGWW